MKCNLRQCWWFAWFFCVVMSTRPAVMGQPTVGNTTVIVHGRVWTADRERPWAEAVAIDGERILAVGSRDEIDRLRGARTQMIDAGSGLIVPGLIDSHIHLTDGGSNLSNVQLRDAATRDEFVQRIAEFARTLEPGHWIVGGDWDHTRWGGELPTRDWIDSVTPHNPVWINRLDGHMALANSAALQEAGVEDDVADVEGGEIVRDVAGRPTGILKDDAMALVDKVVPDETMEERLAAAQAAMDYLVAEGVTCVHHMGTWEHLETFRAAHRRDLLKTRIRAYLPLAEWQRVAREVRAWGQGDDWLRIGGLKGFVDGSLGSHTAAFFDPFLDKPSDRGLLVNTPDDLEAWTAAADREQLQVVVHAIGDRAIRLQLDIYERVAKQNGLRDRRFRIEHAQHIAPNDIRRFAALGVIPSMQPYHAIDDGRWAEALIGPARSETTYAFRSLLDSGALLAFGSDWPVAPATPREGLYAAVTRRTLDGQHPAGWVPQQKIKLEESLRAYTLDAAYAGFSERSLGSLTPGKLADLVVFDRDLFAMPENELATARVVTTIVGGKVVFQRKE